MMPRATLTPSLGPGSEVVLQAHAIGLQLTLAVPVGEHPSAGEAACAPSGAEDCQNAWTQVHGTHCWPVLPAA